MSRRPITFDKEKFIEVATSSVTVMLAAAKLDIHYSTYIRYAKKFGVYRPNQGGKGTHKFPKKGIIPLQEILEGKHPGYSRGHLKKRLLREGLKKNECEGCKNDGTWLGKPLSLQLHHKDGNSRNHRWEIWSCCVRIVIHKRIRGVLRDTTINQFSNNGWVAEWHTR